ncbi:MAG: DegT/DnrJ/EryC1/StrS family aminotransferase [Lachnospiraceae bacterium]|nr:DegT/DnrJ/EryC1/StrS family aminotransferase [Lachnospiraceae bacterium]
MKTIIPVTRSSMPSLEEYTEEIRELWDSRWLTNNGAKHEAFKAELTAFLGVPFAEPVVNGHTALELALGALGITGEVITTPFTFVSTTHAIVRSGLEPVFCDIDSKTCCLDPEKIEDKITERTGAILPVHVYGHVCDTSAIEDIAKRHGLKVIYDAAHTFGERVGEKGIASFGDISCFSFHATKVFHTIEGGAVCFSDPALSERIRETKDFGIRDEEHVDEIGGNGKMNEFSAAMGLCNLRHFHRAVQSRKAAAEHYRERLSEVEGLILPPVQSGVTPNYAYFPVVVDEKLFGKDRNVLAEKLAEKGILVRKYFYPLTSAMECYRGRFKPEETPVALRTAERVLTLPLFEELGVSGAEKVAEEIIRIKNA